ALFGAASNYGTIYLNLVDKSQRIRKQVEIQDIIRTEFSDIPGITVSFAQSDPTSTEGALAVKVFGQDLDRGKLIALEVAKIMKKIEGIVDVETSFSQPQPEYQIKIDRDRAARLGLNVTSIAQTVNTAIKGTVASRFRDGNDEIDILVRFDRSFRESESDLRSIFITSLTGKQIPLMNVATIIPANGPVRINREDQSRYVSVDANISGRDLGSVTSDLRKALETVKMPPDFQLDIGGSAENMIESFMYLAIAILVAIALVYMVMASQFESLLDPFIILFTIPLAFIGVIWALIITGTNVGVTVFIGGMLLVGIVVNNGIVLIDYINQIIVNNPKMELNDAIVLGGKTRLRPILMTALTTILSMTPLALEFGSSAEIWAPMARAVIGGLTAATFLTTIFIPIMYAVFQRKNMAKKRLALAHE
ncbi:MAG: efflux RND transporter permease subunit, partial [Candidatus Marinimicrobia bacterium]|nr:efflux RND transporter permease subunit [Candidatus Neomarinimicrobiota bacterium]